MTGPTVVQTAVASNGGVNIPGPTFGASLTAGNTLVAFVFSVPSAMGLTFPVTGQNGWTLQAHDTDGPSGSINCNVAVYTRTAVSGDSTTPPAPVSSGGGSYNTFAIDCVYYELLGAGSIDLIEASSTGSPSGLTTASQTSGFNNELALVCWQQFNASGLGSLAMTGGGFTQDLSTGVTFGGVVAGHKAIASSGTGVTSTSTGTAGQNNVQYAQVLFQSASAPSTETGNVMMHFGGIAIAAGTTRTETATTGLAFGPLHFAVGAQVIDEAATVAMHFGGIGLKVNVVDINAEPSLVTFFTF